MDIQLKKRPWYIRYKYYLMAAVAFAIFMIYVMTLSVGPRKQRIDTESPLYLPDTMLWKMKQCPFSKISLSRNNFHFKESKKNC